MFWIRKLSPCVQCMYLPSLGDCIIVVYSIHDSCEGCSPLTLITMPFFLKCIRLLENFCWPLRSVWLFKKKRKIKRSIRFVLRTSTIQFSRTFVGLVHEGTNNPKWYQNYRWNRRAKNRGCNYWERYLGIIPCTTPLTRALYTALFLTTYTAHLVCLLSCELCSKSLLQSAVSGFCVAYTWFSEVL